MQLMLLSERNQFTQLRITMDSRAQAQYITYGAYWCVLNPAGFIYNEGGSIKA